MADVNISLRSAEGSEDQPFLLWDTILDPVTSIYDWVVCKFNDPVEPQNGGGLQARVPLDTAILIQLGTKRRAEPGDVLPSGNDPKGWWGDSIQLDDDYGPIGSRLWLLSRAVLNDDTASKAVMYAREALDPLLRQSVVVRFDIIATYSKTEGWLVLDIKGYSQDNQLKYEQQFAPIWALEAAAAARRGFKTL